MVILIAEMKVKKRKASAIEEDVADDSNADEEDSLEVVPKEILVIAQEVKIVQALACNDVNKRNRQMRKLRKWLQLRCRSSFAFSEEDFMRIWKGLYYNFWMSDKPLVQEELAEQMGQLLECFDNEIETSVNFFGAFMSTMCQEWFGIDQWRIDKFLMLVRRMLRYMFRVLRSAGWTETSLQRFNEHMQETVLAEESKASGLVMHYLDVFFEELAKVSEGKISTEQVGALVLPFVHFIGTQRDFKLVSHCRTRIFYHLLYQSGLGREYCEKYNAWKEMGFPTACIDDIEKEETDSVADEDMAEVEAEPILKQLDPRAGNIDVFMPELQLDAKHIIEALEILIYKRESSTKCRKMLKKLLEVFLTYQRGEFPLGVKTMPRVELKSEKPLIQDKISQLENLENEMYGTVRKLKQLNKRKRRKLLKSLNFDDVDDSNFEQMIEKALPKTYLKERRKRAQGSMMNGWLEEEIEQADVTPKKKKLKITVEQLNGTEKQAFEVSTQKITKRTDKTNTQVSSVSSVSSLKKAKVIELEAANKPSPIQNMKGKSEIEKKANKMVQQEKVEVNNPMSTKNDMEKSPGKTSNALTTSATKKANQLSEWEKPLADGEIEYFIPARKLQLKKANADLVLNPLAKKHSAGQSTPTPKDKHKAASSRLSLLSSPKTPASVKRVKIALKHNTVQNPSEYIKQIKSSPDVPYNAEKKPGKGLLKPHSMPSPINPFYKKKIGLRLLNDTT